MKRERDFANEETLLLKQLRPSAVSGMNTNWWWRWRWGVNRGTHRNGTANWDVFFFFKDI